MQKGSSWRARGRVDDEDAVLDGGEELGIYMLRSSSCSGFSSHNWSVLDVASGLDGKRGWKCRTSALGRLFAHPGNWWLWVLCPSDARDTARTTSTAPMPVLTFARRFPSNASSVYHRGPSLGHGPWCCGGEQVRTSLAASPRADCKSEMLSTGYDGQCLG